jgi:hypothetical protein
MWQEILSQRAMIFSLHHYSRRLNVLRSVSAAMLTNIVKMLHLLRQSAQTCQEALLAGARNWADLASVWCEAIGFGSCLQRRKRE